MKPASVIAGLLIVLGVMGLFYEGYAIATHRKLVDPGPVQATAEDRRRIPVAPMLAAAALLGGLVILIGTRRPP